MGRDDCLFAEGRDGRTILWGGTILWFSTYYSYILTREGGGGGVPEVLGPGHDDGFSVQYYFAPKLDRKPLDKNIPI